MKKASPDILIVEDSPTQAAQMRYMLQAEGYICELAANGREGLAAAREHQPLLIISDIVMPEMDGFEMTRAIKEDRSVGNIPVILVSSLSNPEDVVQAINAGADYYMFKPYDKDFFLTSVKGILDTLPRETASASPVELDLLIDGKTHPIKFRPEQILTLFFSIYQNAQEQNHQLRKTRNELQEFNDRLEGLIKEKTEELSSSFLGSTQAISELLETRDPYTAGHARGVTELAIQIGERMGMSIDEIEGLRVCGILHDLGKVAVSSGILNKPGKLSNNEFGIIRQHPDTAYQALHRIPFPWPVADVVRQHHERLDGTGYPQGLKNGEIHPWARILAVADVVDAMIKHRPYRPALPKQIVIEELDRGCGTIYDARVVEECLAVIQKDSSRVLVVDDEPMSLKVMMRFLEDMNLECEGYEDGTTAFAAFMEKPFSLLITDINMPGMNGLELLKKMREINSGCEAIIVTGYGEKKYLLEAMRLGASDFLEKPLEMNSFKTAVRRILKLF